MDTAVHAGMRGGTSGALREHDLFLERDCDEGPLPFTPSIHAGGSVSKVVHGTARVWTCTYFATSQSIGLVKSTACAPALHRLGRTMLNRRREPPLMRRKMYREDRCADTAWPAPRGEALESCGGGGGGWRGCS